MNLEERASRTRALPNGRAIVEAGYVIAGFGIHRDSDPLDESNYNVAMRRLAEAADMAPFEIVDLGTPDEPDADRPAIVVGHFGHWAVGWADELLVRSDRPHLLRLADDLLAMVDEYPILDEDDYSEREWDANHPDDEHCYSDDEHCACGRERA